MIDSYHSGRIAIDGKAYTSDVIISPNGDGWDWWHQKTQELNPEDLSALIVEYPEVFIVGTGISGTLKALPVTKIQVEAEKFRLIAETTDRAFDAYSQLCHSQRVIAALHPTC
jgi:hypothetical protein